MTFMTINQHMPEYKTAPEVEPFTDRSGKQMITVTAGGMLFLDLAHAEHVRNEITRLLAEVSSDVATTPED